MKKNYYDVLVFNENTGLNEEVLKNVAYEVANLKVLSLRSQGKSADIWYNFHKYATAEITKDNIHLYYEFMSFDDILNNLDLLNNVLFERYFYILNHFKDISFINENKNTYKSLREWEQIQFKNKHIKKDGYKYYEISFFDIKDTLKSIDEYIAEIKESEAYKNYIAKKL